MVATVVLRASPRLRNIAIRQYRKPA